MGAVVLALMSVGVLVWSNAISLPFFTSYPSNQELMARMTEVSQSGGIAATFSAKDISKWQLPDGHKLERFSLTDAETGFARLTSTGPVDNNRPNWEERGLSLTLPVEFNNRTRGKRLEIGIVARSAQTRPSEALLAVYATRQAGNSGWQELVLQSGFQLTTFTYDVPAIAEEYTNAPILVLHSDRAGAGGSVEILGIYIKILN